MLPRQCSGYHRDHLRGCRSLMAVVVDVTTDFELEELRGRGRGEGGRGRGDVLMYWYVVGGMK